MMTDLAAELTTMAKGAPQSLEDFRRDVRDQIEAILTAGRDMLEHGSGGELPTGARVELSVGANPAEDDATIRSVDCWDHTYACGKSPSGYIYCTVRVCMIV